MLIDRELLGAAQGITSNLETLRHADTVRGMTTKRALQAALLAYGSAFCRIGELLGMDEKAALRAVVDAQQAGGASAYH